MTQFPPTPWQRALSDRMLSESDRALYLTQDLWQIRGALNIGAFEAAWNAVVSRHSGLRASVIRDEVGEPLLRVEESAVVRPVWLDWRDKSDPEKEPCLEEFRVADRSRPLDAGETSMMRLTLIRLEAELWWMVWTVHHLILDRRSMTLVLDELVQCYEAYVVAAQVNLPTVPGIETYAEWVAEHNDIVEARWQPQMAGSIAASPLPGERSRILKGDSRRESIHWELSGDDQEALLSACRSWGVTLSCAMRACWALVLEVFTSEVDIVFGVSVSERTAPVPGVEQMVGPLTSIAPVRIQVELEDTILDWLQSIEDRTEMNGRHRGSPMETEGWSEARSDNTIIRSILMLEEPPLNRLKELGGDQLKLRHLERSEETGIPLALTVIVGERIDFDITFDAQQLHPAIIQSLANCLETIIGSLPVSAEIRVGDLVLTSARDQATLSDLGRGPERRFEEPTWLDAFAGVVKRCPDRVAVRSPDGSLPYKELDRLSDRVASEMIKRGVKKGSPVPVLLNRSALQVAAWLGVLKVGAALVPLDPEYPDARILAMLHGTEATHVVTSPNLADRIPPSSLEIVRLSLGSLDQAESQPLPHVADRDLAYVIFTSGSSGEPRGVLVEHRSLLNYALGAVESYGLSPKDRVLQFASLSFDFSFAEVFPALASGATLVLREERHLGATTDFWSACQQDAISVLMLPTAFWNQMAKRVIDRDDHVPESIRLVSIGGERAEPILVRNWLDAVPHVRLINGYGPTEATVEATLCDLSTIVGDDAWHEVPIGRPMANVNVLVLRPERPVMLPAGGVGELVIGGSGVARGYLSNASNEEAFALDPFDATHVYRTGDRVRWLPSGHLEYLGRWDDQIKVRGFRVEMGEVAAVLLGHPSVREAVVAALDGPQGGKRLVAYVVLGEQTSSERLREYVARVLPQFMTPDVIMPMESLPRTPNDKIDRGALPDPGFELDNATDSVSPATPVELALAEIWANVLQLSKVSANDNFFDLGGDSLLSIQVLSQARSRGMKLSLRQVINASTLRSLAAVVESATNLTDQQDYSPRSSEPEDETSPSL